MEQSVTTTSKEIFTWEEQCQLARLIYKRFGKDPIAALSAWRRMMQNHCTAQDFDTLLKGKSV